MPHNRKINRLLKRTHTHRSTFAFGQLFSCSFRLEMCMFFYLIYCALFFLCLLLFFSIRFASNLHSNNFFLWAFALFVFLLSAFRCSVCVSSFAFASRAIFLRFCVRFSAFTASNLSLSDLHTGACICISASCIWFELFGFLFRFYLWIFSFFRIVVSLRVLFCCCCSFSAVNFIFSSLLFSCHSISSVRLRLFPFSSDSDTCTVWI